MTEHEKYQEHIRHTHDAFCKTVIRHAAIDAARSIRSRRKREISLEYLIEEKHYPCCPFVTASASCFPILWAVS